jgi:hypothetical protein
VSTTTATGDQADLSLRLANGTTKTADIDFQSESRKWQATAMKVSP